MLITHGTLLTFDDDLGVIHDGALRIEGETIEEVGDLVPRPGEPVLDAAGCVVLPGLINLHTHFYGQFARGIAPAGPTATNFTEILERLWWPLDRALEPEDIYLSAALGALDALHAGVTTAIDHHAGQRCIRGSLDAVARAVEETGLRASLCFEVSDREGPSAAADGIAENLAFLDRAEGRLVGLFGLHASFTVGRDTAAAVRRAVEGRRVGFHVHVAEDAADQRDAQATHGRRVVERLVEEELLNERSLAAHCVHVDANEVRLLAERGVAVAHNPQSNRSNGVGACRADELDAAGVCVGLGSDGYTANILDELRAARLLLRDRLGPDAGGDLAFRMLFRNNPRVASSWFGTTLGVLRPGAAADLVVTSYDPPTPLHAGNVEGHVLFGLHPGHIRNVVVSGATVVEEGRAARVDEAALRSAARERAQALWQRWRS